MKNKSINLKLSYQQILGITLSKSSNEFILHINYDEQDFYFTSKNKNLVISQILKLFHASTNKNLKLCEVDQKRIKQYITSKKDKKKNTAFTKLDEKLIIDSKQFVEKNEKINGNEIEKDKLEKKEKLEQYTQVIKQ